MQTHAHSWELGLETLNARHHLILPLNNHLLGLLQTTAVQD